MIYIYDIETYINYFGVIFKNIKTKEIQNYRIYHNHENTEHNINDIKELFAFLNTNKTKWLVGYNSKSFDNQILNFIYSQYKVLIIFDEKTICGEIYKLTASIISSNNTEYKYKLPFQSVDLMKVGNVDQKSLKLVAVNLNWPLIQDLPFAVNSIISNDNLEMLYKYNLNDVEITEALYYKLIKDITVRWEVGKKYGLDLMSEPDSGMANRLLEKMYSDASGIPIKELRELRTERKIIHYENIVFPDIKFNSIVLKNLLNEILSQKYYKNQPFFSKSVIFDGIKYKLGIGGIHSDDKPRIFTASDDLHIVDCDIDKAVSH